jgi:hypothetical protein
MIGATAWQLARRPRLTGLGSGCDACFNAQIHIRERRTSQLLPGPYSKITLYNFASVTMPPFRKGPDNGGILYFAYGSNLHVAQMAQRCPNSIFIGKGSLADYRWQINERGVANVVRSGHGSVEGLVYLVGQEDERSLDRSEGVAKKFYQKHILTVNLVPHDGFHELKSAEVASLIADASADASYGYDENGETLDATEASSKRNVNDGDAELPDSGPSPHLQAAQRQKVLVYVSERFMTDGKIREEYIYRMRKARANALMLGVSRSFIESQMDPSIGSPETPEIPQATPVATESIAAKDNTPKTRGAVTERENEQDAHQNNTDQRDSGQSMWFFIRGWTTFALYLQWLQATVRRKSRIHRKPDPRPLTT